LTTKEDHVIAGLDVRDPVGGSFLVRFGKPVEIRSTTLGFDWIDWIVIAEWPERVVPRWSEGDLGISHTAK